MKWLKFYGQDWLTDLKIRGMSPEDRLCFITLLCLASNADEGGLIRHCNEEAVISLTNLEDNPYDDDNYYNRAKGCLKRYEALQIVTLSGNGDVTVCNFGRRQGENLSNAEKQKNYRERRKITTKSSNKRYVTQSNERYPRIEENRIDKNRVDIGEVATPPPSKINQDFFSEGEIYKSIYEEFCSKINPLVVDREFKKFILYWTEPSKSGNKQRWEQQPTFEVKRRLYNWFSKIAEKKQFTSVKGRGLEI